MNIIRKYLDYRKNNKAIRHYEKIIEPREEDVLFIGSPSLEDLARNYSPQLTGDDDKKLKMTPVLLQSSAELGYLIEDTLTPQDYRGEDQEVIKFWKNLK